MAKDEIPPGIGKAVSRRALALICIVVAICINSVFRGLQQGEGFNSLLAAETIGFTLNETSSHYYQQSHEKGRLLGGSTAETIVFTQFEETVRETTRLLYADSPHLSTWLDAPLPKIYIYDNLEESWSNLTNISASVEARFAVPSTAYNFTGCSWYPHICDKAQKGPVHPKVPLYLDYKTNYNADAAHLRWFENYPYLTSNATAADLFVVPFPQRSYALTRFNFRRQKGDLTREDIQKHVHKKLSYLNQYPTRHLYLHGGGLGELTSLPFYNSLNMSDKVTLSYGPAIPCFKRFDRPCGHVVVPMLDVRNDYQPPVIKEKLTEGNFVLRDRTFAVGARIGVSPVMKLRHAISSNVSHYVPKRIGGLPTLATFISARGKTTKRHAGGLTITELYRSSTFCLILPGDATWQKRFFDVMLNGCIPLVPSFFPSNERDTKYVTFYRWRGHPSTRTTYPWSKGIFFGDDDAGIDYMDLVLPFDGYNPYPSLAETVERTLQNVTEVHRLRRNIMKFVQLFTHGLDDNMYRYADAFTATLVALRHYVHSLDGKLP